MTEVPAAPCSKFRQVNVAERDRMRDFEPDWTQGCEVCGQRPIMPATGMCGPCSTGEAETVGGEW